MRYAIVIEKAGANYSAYVPDLPGASQLAARCLKSSSRAARLLSFIHLACVRMERPFLRHRVRWITWMLQPSNELERSGLHGGRIVLATDGELADAQGLSVAGRSTSR